MKPCCWSDRIWCASRCLMIWLCIMCSRILLHTDVKDMDLYVVALLQSPFLKMDVTLSCFQSSGTLPCCKEAWNIRVIAAVNSTANFFRNLVGIWSGPSALWGFMPCISFWTPAWSTEKLCMSGYWLPPMVGKSVVVSSVKTPQNWSLRMVAFVFGSLCAMPSFFNVETPLLSHLFPLTNV